MKKIILIAVSFLLIFPCFSQQKQTYKIYNSDFGIKDLFPSKIIEKNYRGDYKVYKTTYGIKDLYPSKIVKKKYKTKNKGIYNKIKNTNTSSKTTEYKVYNTTFGIPDIFPSKIIRKSNKELLFK